MAGDTDIFLPIKDGKAADLRRLTRPRASPRLDIHATQTPLAFGWLLLIILNRFLPLALKWLSFRDDGQKWLIRRPPCYALAC